MVEKKVLSKFPVVIIKTSKGNITLELNREKAPITVENFLEYLDSKYYNGTIFHRVIPNFMIQGGGFTKDFSKKPTDKPIQNEAYNGLKNDVGTIAMARTAVVNSATNQFFINLKNNSFLNHRNKNPRGYGYCVFGKVIDGMNVVNAIQHVKTTTKRHHAHVPIKNVIIKEIVRIK
ncbi:MAG: peptidylprolyl isomerase [Verrucomicrobiota bacterium]|nr:peptidylprolyl isomerase [Verrucomicrobiota bacterium]